MHMAPTGMQVKARAVAVFRYFNQVHVGAMSNIFIESS